MLQRYADRRAVINLSLPTNMVDRLNDLAIEQGTNRSALIKDAINAMYFGTPNAQHEEGYGHVAATNEDAKGEQQE